MLRSYPIHCMWIKCTHAQISSSVFPSACNHWQFQSSLVNKTSSVHHMTFISHNTHITPSSSSLAMYIESRTPPESSDWPVSLLAFRISVDYSTIYHYSYACQSVCSFITFDYCMVRHEQESNTVKVRQLHYALLTCRQVYSFLVSTNLFIVQSSLLFEIKTFKIISSVLLVQSILFTCIF